MKIVMSIAITIVVVTLFTMCAFNIIYLRKCADELKMQKSVCNLTELTEVLKHNNSIIDVFKKQIILKLNNLENKTLSQLTEVLQISERVIDSSSFNENLLRTENHQFHTNNFNKIVSFLNTKMNENYLKVSTSMQENFTMMLFNLQQLLGNSKKSD